MAARGTDQNSKLSFDNKHKKIGILLLGEGTEFFDNMKQGFFDRAEDFSKLDFELILKQTKAVPDQQLKELSAMEKKKIDGLIICPCNDTRILSEIDKLVDKGIPVMCVNNDLPESKRFAFVGSDSYKSGVTAGGLMGLITDGVAEVAIIDGTLGIKGLEDRIAGFKDCIAKNYPKIKIKTIEHCNSDDYKTYETVQSVLMEFPDITAFFFTSGGVYGGCKSIYQLTQRYPFTIITYELTEAIKGYLEKGIITASICQNPHQQGSDALTIMIDKLFLDREPKNEINHADIFIKIKESL